MLKIQQGLLINWHVVSPGFSKTTHSLWKETPRAYCSVPTEAAHRRHRYTYKSQMMRSWLQIAPRTSRRRQAYIQPARDSCSKLRDRCSGRKADGVSFFLPKYTVLGFSKEKFIPEIILPTLQTSCVLSLLKSKDFTGCSSKMNQRCISELPRCYFATSLAVQVSSFCWLLGMPALQSGWHHLNI